MKFLFIVFSSILYLNGIAQNAEEVVVYSDSIALKGTLLIPKSSVSMQVALIIAGSGPTDRNGNNPQSENNSLKMLAEGLPENGIASLRYDKRGVAASAYANMDEGDLNFDNLVDDAKLWIDLLSKDQRFNRIIVIGHSEGSLIGMLTAQLPEVDKYISVAGPGRKANEILLEQIKTGSPIFSIAASNILDSLANGFTVSSLPEPLKVFFRPSVQPYLISWFKYDPSVEIAKLNKPVLIIQGNTDIQVPVSDAELLAEANPNAKLVVIEGMNHVFKEAPIDRSKNIATYSNPNLSVVPIFINEIVDFINENE